jgi:hypothetical protein
MLADSDHGVFLYAFYLYVFSYLVPLWSSGQSSWLTERRCIVFPARYELNLYMLCRREYRLCGLVVRVPTYRSGGPGSIPGGTGFSEK